MVSREVVPIQEFMQNLDQDMLRSIKEVRTLLTGKEVTEHTMQLLALQYTQMEPNR